MDCFIKSATDGKKSVLEAELLNIFKSRKAADAFYAKIQGEDFKKIFGDWEKKYNSIGDSVSPNTGATYSNGEPKVFKVKNTNQYYVKLLDGTSLFLNKKGLRGSFTSQEIKDTSKYFLFRYVQEGGSKSFNEMDAEKNQSKMMLVIEKAISDYRVQLEGYPDGKAKTLLSNRISRVELFKSEFRSQLTYELDALGQKFRESIRDAEGNLIGEVLEEDKSGALNITESTTVNAKDTATVNTKILLSQLESRKINKKTRKKEIVRSKFLATPVFEDFTEVWETLQPLLADKVAIRSNEGVLSSYEKMRSIVDSLKDNKPWAEDLGRKLDKMYNDNDGGRYKVLEFVQAFNKTKLNYYVTEFNRANSAYTMYNATATNSRESQIMDRWGIMFADLFLENGKQTYLSKNGVDEINKIEKQVVFIHEEFNQMLKNAGDDRNLINESFQYAATNLFGELNKLGVFGLKDSDMNSLIFLGGGNQNEKKTVNDLFVGVMHMINGDITKIDKKGNGVLFSDEFGDGKNPYRSQHMVKMLAQAMAMRELDIAESSILASGSKTYFAYSNPTYISNKINEWKEDDSGLQELFSQQINQSSKWMYYLLASHLTSESARLIESKKRLSKFQSSLASSFTSKGKDDGVDNVHISLSDQINDNLAKMLRGATVKGGSMFPTIIAADKSRRVEFKGLEFIDSRIYLDDTGNVVIPEKTVSIFTNYFNDEYGRMAEVARDLDNLPENKRINNYHTGNQNGLKSQIFPEFSVENAKGELASMLYKDGKPIGYKTGTGFSSTQQNMVSKYVKESLKERFLETQSEIKNLRETSYVDSTLINHYKDKGGDVAMAGDYLINGLVSSIEYTKMFSGDPAFYKNLPDLIKRIPATYTDGLQLALSDKDDMKFNMAVVNNVDVASKYQKVIYDSLSKDYKHVANAYGKYKDNSGNNVNTTDAQAWITPRRWRFLKQKLGQWSSTHDDVFKKMENGVRLEGSELALAAQPLKGVYFEINKGVPTYLKYSQAVLVPSMVKGTPMQRLLDKMQGPTTVDLEGNTIYEVSGANETHEVVTVDGVKVGAIAPTTINKIVDGKGTTDLADEFDLNTNTLSNMGWKLQQDLPVKTMHETNLGSQIQKNILEGLKLDEKYKTGNEEVDGSVMVQKIHEAISNLIEIGAGEVSSRLGIVDNKITDDNALYEVLISEFRQRGGNENIITALEKRTKFDAIPQIRGRVNSILMSVFNRAITKISTEGGSFIQVSPFGLEKFDKTSGIVQISENYDDEGLQPPRKGEDGETLSGQVLIPHTLALKLLKSAGEDLLTMTPSKWMKFFKDPKTRELVGYRIPNQGMSSNDTLEIVGILPETMGDSIIGYDAIPAKTGSDFDIDKMYIMAPNLMFSKKDKKFEVLNEKNKKFYNGSKNATKLVAQNKVLELYGDILKSRHTYDNMMTSIDGKDLKEDIDNLHPKDDAKNLDLFSPITQLKSKKGYMDGTTGIGLTANQLVDHVANQSVPGIGLNIDLGIGNEAQGSKNDKHMLMDVNTKGKRTIAHTLSFFLNAYVDIAKDNYITRGNHNDITANVSFMLIRAGASMETVNRYIGQPILKEYVELKKREKSITSLPLTMVLSDGTVVNTDAMGFLKNKYSIGTYEDSRLKLRDITNKQLENNIKGQKVKYIDSVVLNSFEEFEKKAAQFTDAVLASKVDTKGAGGSPIEMHIRQNKIAKISEVNFVRNYFMKFEGTALGTYKKYALDFVSDVLEKSNIELSATRGAKDTFDTISSKLTRDNVIISEKLGKAIDKGVYSYLMSGTTMMSENRSDFNKLFVNLPKDIINLKKTSKNLLIKELEIQMRGGYNFIGINGKDKPQLYQNNIYGAWMDLYESEDTNKIAIDLVRYSYSQSGFSSNLNQFFTHIPHEILAENGLNSEINEFFLKINGIAFDSNFSDQFARHESKNTDVVPRAHKGDYLDSENIHYGFTGSEKMNSKYMSYKNGQPYQNHPEFMSVDLGEGVIGLYKLEDLTYIGQDNENSSPVYKRTYQLGYKAGKNRVFEYSYNNSIVESILPENNFDASFNVAARDFVEKELKGNTSEEAKDEMNVSEKVEENDNHKTENDYISDGNESNQLQDSSDEVNAYKITSEMLATVATKTDDC